MDGMAEADTGGSPNMLANAFLPVPQLIWAQIFVPYL
jgi:hypothetical protein